MKTSDFSFELPPELIAQEPTGTRGDSRLMVVDRATGTRRDMRVADICEYIPAGSVMVFNNSRVRKARVYATPNDSETPREFLLVRRTAPNRWLAIGKNIMRLAPERELHFPAGVRAHAGSVFAPYRELVFDHEIDDTWLDQNGHVPLPPYIRRPDSSADEERYQTVYAESTGSVAAPTAGLHFTSEILAALRSHGVRIEFVTLHVGIGTFLPVRTVEVESHHMHEEHYHVSHETAATVTEAVHDGRPVVAVGTTAIRTLESAWDAEVKELRPGHGNTELFIFPGYRFEVVRHIFTNFHTPESTLLVLVSAFAGRDLILRSYAEAVEKRYRFFSYGDAMLIL